MVINPLFRKVLSYILLVLLLVTCTSYSDTNKTITMGVFDAPPYVFKDGNQYKGFYIDIINHIVKSENWNLQFKYMTWSEGLNKVKNGELDLWPAVMYSKERDTFLDYTKESIIVTWVQLYTYNNSGIYDIIDIANKKVAILKEDRNAELFKEHIKRFQIDCEFIEYLKYKTLFRDLEDKKVDAAVASNGPGNYYSIGANIRSTNVVLNPTPGHFVTSEGSNKYILDTISKYITKWKNNESSLYYESINHWLGKKINIKTAINLPIKLDLTIDETKWLNDNPLIILAVDETYPPLNFRGNNGRMEGLSIDYINAIIKKLGVLVKYEGSLWPVALQKALDHKVDGIVNASSLEERKPYLNFTKSYTTLPQGLVTLNNRKHINTFSDLDNSILCAKKDTSHLALLKTLTKAKIIEVNTLEEAFGKVLTEEAFGVFDDVAVLSYLLQKYNFTTLKMNLVHYDTSIGETGIGLRNDEPILLSVFNKAILSITSDEHKEIQKKWLTQPPTEVITTHFNWILLIKIVIPMLVLFILISFFIILHNNRLKRVVKLKTKELADSQSFIKSVMDNLPIGVSVNSVDPEVNFTYMNDAFPIHFRTTREELEKRDNFWNAIFEDEEYREWIKEKVISDCNTGDVSKMHWDAVEIRKDGKIIAYVNTANTPFEENQIMISTVIDVTKRIRAQQELKESEQFLRETNKLAKVGGFELHGDGFTRWTRELYYIYEIPKEEDIYFDNVVEEFHTHEIEKLEMFNDILYNKKEKAIVELKFKSRHSKTNKWTRVIATPLLDDDGEIAVVVGAAQDITELRIQQLETERISRQLQQAQKMEAIGALAGGVAHDFNNILSAIVGYSELAMQDVENSDSLKKYIREVLKGADRATKLVRQILTFSSARDNEERDAFKISLIVKEALKLLRPSIPTTIQIEQVIDCDKLALVNTTQIHQVVMNLCTNAYQAMKEDGGTLSIKLTEIEKTIYNGTIPSLKLTNGQYIQLTIGDTGPGMTQEIKQKIFEPYFTTKQNEKGTGLGLAVVHGIIQQHGGCVNVYSEVGFGTIFNVYLPICDEKKNKIIPNNHDTPKHTNGNETIMIVDDESAITNLMSDLLKRNGYTVHAFSDGIQALNYFRKDNLNVDLIITDMTMPYMTGMDLTRKVFEIIPDFPIILCTGHSDIINKESALKMGIKQYLTKPFSNNSLLENIRIILDKQ